MPDNLAAGPGWSRPLWVIVLPGALGKPHDHDTPCPFT
jgi:hypothetical protein